MESSSPPQENVDSKTEFRKPSGDAANRKYRRRSPVDGSFSSDDSPSRKRSPGKESAKVYEDHRRKVDRRDLDKDSGWSRHGRSGELFRDSDRQTSRSSHSYRRHDDNDGHKYADKGDREDSKLSSRSGRDSRGKTYSDHSKREAEFRSRDNPREYERYSRDKFDSSGHRNRDQDKEASYAEYQKFKDKDSSSDRAVSGRRHTSSNTEDERSGDRDRDRRKEDRDAGDYKPDPRRGLGDYKKNHSPTREESKDYQKDSTSRRDSYGRRLHEASRSSTKAYGAEKYGKEERGKYDDRDRYKERFYGESREEVDDQKSPQSKGRDSPAKKPKLFTNASSSHEKDDEKQYSGGKQVWESAGKPTSEQAYVTDSDIDAAKLAAMKAAELVNRNLIGTGYMSTEQKKKLLWGNKKTTTTEEPAHRWDSALFGDRERQEKFNKLMSLRLPWCLWPIVGSEGRGQSGKQARHGRGGEAENSVRLGEAIHCWTPTKRRTDSWVGSLMIYNSHSSTIYVFFISYFCATYLFLMILHSVVEFVCPTVLIMSNVGFLLCHFLLRIKNFGQFIIFLECSIHIIPSVLLILIQ